MARSRDLKSVVRKDVRVRLPPSAPQLFLLFSRLPSTHRQALPSAIDFEFRLSLRHLCHLAPAPFDLKRYYQQHPSALSRSTKSLATATLHPQLIPLYNSHRKRTGSVQQALSAMPLRCSLRPSIFQALRIKPYSFTDSSDIGCRTSYQSSLEMSEHGYSRN